MVDSVTLDDGMSFDELKTEHASEIIRYFYSGVALPVARAAMRLDERDDLDVIQAILSANGRSRRIVEEFGCGTGLIGGGDYDSARGISYSHRLFGVTSPDDRVRMLSTCNVHVPPTCSRGS